MKVSEITVDYLAEYLHIDDLTERAKNELASFLVAAKSFTLSYTGLSEEQLEQYEDITIAICVQVQDFYDNRNLQGDFKQMNPTVLNILNLHSRNLL